MGLSFRPDFRLLRGLIVCRCILRHCLLAEFDLGCALSALVLRRFSDGCDVGVIAEIFAEGASKDAHASAMNNADAWETGEEGAVEEAFDFGLSLIGGASDHIDL